MKEIIIHLILWLILYDSKNVLAIRCRSMTGTTSTVIAGCQSCERIEFLYNDGTAKIILGCTEPPDTLDTICHFFYYCNNQDRCNNDPHEINTKVIEEPLKIKCSCRDAEGSSSNGKMVNRTGLKSPTCLGFDCDIDTTYSSPLNISVPACINSVWYRNAKIDLSLSSADCGRSYREFGKLKIQESRCICSNGNLCNDVENRKNSSASLRFSSDLFLLKFLLYFFLNSYLTNKSILI